MKTKVEVNQKFEIAKRVDQLEKTLIHKLDHLEAVVDSGKETFQFVKDGLSGYRERILKNIALNRNENSVSLLNEKIKEDTDLGHPHKKVMDSLMGQYDYANNQFQPIHFSKLVKDAKIGKNKAGEYLKLLRDKGYIDKEETGYRTYYRIRG